MPAVTLTAAMVGGGAHLVLDSIPKPTGRIESSRVFLLQDPLYPFIQPVQIATLAF